MAFCGVALLVGFFPALFFRPDLYGVLAAFFAIRYVGGALITKTWLMQPLDQYLSAPVAAYCLSCLLMFVVVAVILTVRALTAAPRFSPCRRTSQLSGSSVSWPS